MSDVRESLPVLEGASGEGQAIRAVQVNDSTDLKNGILGFSFKNAANEAVLAPVTSIGAIPADAVPGLVFIDSQDVLTYPRLNAAGQLPVTNLLTGSGYRARGTLSGSSSFVTVASLSLDVSSVYNSLEYIVSCFRDSIFQVVFSDNGAEDIISDARCGAGQYTFNGAIRQAEYHTGATGPQLLFIRAKNLNALSDFTASFSLNLNFD